MVHRTATDMDAIVNPEEAITGQFESDLEEAANVEEDASPSNDGPTNANKQLTDQLADEVIANLLNGAGTAESNSGVNAHQVQKSESQIATVNPVPAKNDLPNNCLLQVKKLHSADQLQYIKRRDVDISVHGNLPYSAKFQAGGVQWKLRGEGGLLTSTNKYVAQVSIEPLDEIDQETSFDCAIEILREKLKVIKVLLDDHLQEVQNSKQKLDDHLKKMFDGTMDDIQKAEDLFQIERILSSGVSDYERVVTAIKKNTSLSVQTKQILSEHIELEVKDIARSTVFSKIRSFFIGTRACTDVLKERTLTAIRNHKAKALEMCPDIMRRHLQKLENKHTLFITKQDVTLFSVFLNTMEDTALQAMFPSMIESYCNTITSLKTNQLKTVLPIKNHIFYYLCKSLSDISEELASKSMTKDLIKYTAGGWKQINTVQWISTPSALDKCLEKQLSLMMELVNHFQVGSSSAFKRFPYQFKLFGNIESKPEYQQVIAQVNRAFGHQCNQNSSVMPNELHVWICLLDDTIAQLFSKDKHIIKMCSTLLKLYINYSLSGQMTANCLESLRVVTHNTIRFVAQAGPFVHPQNDQDNEILLKQIGFMSRASLEGRMSFEDYRDLIEVFAQYWRQRSDAIEEFVAKIHGEHFKQDVEDIKLLLLQCMARALDKNVELTNLINFCRVYEELLIDLHKLPIEWFVRMPSKEYLDVFFQKDTIKVVENKWNDNEHQCYCVKDADKFKKCFNALLENEDLPRNFIVETIKKLLGCIINLETKERWCNSTALTESEQLNATRLLITSVRSSLLYLKEQPESINFEQFLEESTKPFTTVCDESSSFEDFEKRVLLIKESFWYIRNLNAINIDTALKLYKENNKSDYSEENLRLCYLKYTKQFEQFMGANSELSLQKRIQRVVEDTSQIVERSLTSQWTAEFKHQKLPLILAGLAAVWAMHVSKDVASTGQYLKPHCIQILCVFRLLSADRNDQGVRKHLAQVLTGQGKSLVLTMVASILVFCGHSVQVMCYSNYLASRDEKDFEDFYDFFGIREKISYQTFKEAASERVEKIAGNARTYLSKCIGVPEQSSYSGVLRPNPIMLIDEVDVFFDKRLHGETYNLGFSPKIPGLDKIHLEIWKLLKENCSNVRQAINDYINNESDSEVAEFNKIMNKPGQYSLYTNAGDKNNVTNQSLFSSHIDEMIATAKKVYAMKSNDSFLCKFRLSDAGNITVKDSFGNYTDNTIYGYYNVFIYLKLKQTDFEKGTYNYGYFNLSLGSTSYAKIPEAFPLILGVSGTLTTLSNYEKKIVNNYYNIQEMSVMSSFFGASNLKFNQVKDFNCFNSVTSWMHAIFARINTIINAGRSVLVIFDTDTSINAFKLQFVAQLDRLNVLTVNTRPSDKERFISDAGVSKTITLATRGMGRGVDYKSSVAVEMNGGVHVIQSFFSEDIKEETQIKGRTARKDNRGSYELIVCIEDLKKQNLVESFESSSTVTYQRLHESRKREMTKKDATRDEQLSKANRLHDATVSFYKDR